MTLELPAAAARHAQVLRLQPGARLVLFGHAGASEEGGEFGASVTAMTRNTVQVTVGPHERVERESQRHLTLAVGMPANERMDWLVEKATELGATSIQPLMTERSVVRLDAERGARKLAHWQSVAVAACEQCGRNRVPQLRAPMTFARWLEHRGTVPLQEATSLVLSLQPRAIALPDWRAQADQQLHNITFLCGPEGGLSAKEEALAIESGHVPVSLGTRVLRTETAALAALTLLA